MRTRPRHFEDYAIGEDRISHMIHTALEVTEKEPDPKRPGFGRIVETIRVLNQCGETVLACDHILLAKMKSPG